MQISLKKVKFRPRTLAFSAGLTDDKAKHFGVAVSLTLTVPQSNNSQLFSLYFVFQGCSGIY
jgi:hypothetical protein